MAKSDYAAALSHPRPSKKKPELDHLRIHEAENGGHIVEHHFDNRGAGPYVEEEHYAFGDHKGGKPKLPDGHVLHHIAKHMNMPHEVMAEEMHESAAERKAEDKAGEE